MINSNIFGRWESFRLIGNGQDMPYKLNVMEMRPNGRVLYTTVFAFSLPGLGPEEDRWVEESRDRFRIYTTSMFGNEVYACHYDTTLYPYPVIKAEGSDGSVTYYKKSE